MSAAAPRAWYREPYVWMVIAIPATAVVMGVVMVWLAIESDDGLVQDDYYRSGLQINQVLDRDRAAHALGLEARLGIDAAAGRARLDLSRPLPHPVSTLTLHMYHATRAGLDHDIRLEQVSATQFVGSLPALPPGAWNIEVGASDWRIGGRLERTPSDAALVTLSSR